ncbi:MAG TPA: DUF2461 domain-containing protein, partial [Candidatus Acidoferrales bacterium]|nr:DUF2461 domain-containing protein [Candidatus Acidoferrales bacterium]
TLTADTFRFFRELKKNNSKVWMDANRDRYKQHVIEPLRGLLDTLAPGMQKLHPAFSIGGRTGENFSRINRDIRFAKDKTPYYTHMYLFFSCADKPGRAGGQLYVGISADSVTIGFRIYHGGRASAMACICGPRAIENLDWLARRQKKFARKFEGYWYSSEKGSWTKHSGWPSDAKEWTTAKGWIVRRKLSAATATKPSFCRQIEKTLRELFPLYRFACLQEWKS